MGGDEVDDAFLNLFYEYVELLLFGLASTAFEADGNGGAGVNSYLKANT